MYGFLADVYITGSTIIIIIIQSNSIEMDCSRNLPITTVIPPDFPLHEHNTNRAKNCTAEGVRNV